MGASGWDYFVPYQEDVNKALQDLRQQVFESGDYYKSWEKETEPGPLDEAIDRLSKDEKAHLFAGIEEPEIPQTIEELIELNATEGTHSIIDMEGVFLEALPEGEEGEFGTIYPLSTEDLLELFESDKPTRELIENVEEASPGLISEYAPGRWTGVFITFYKDDIPDGYFFSGYSGD